MYLQKLPYIPPSIRKKFATLHSRDFKKIHSATFLQVFTVDEL